MERVVRGLLGSVFVLLLTSAWFGVCYFYKLIGISTAP